MICQLCHYYFPAEEGIKDLLSLRSYRLKARGKDALVICPRCTCHHIVKWDCDIRAWKEEQDWKRRHLLTQEQVDEFVELTMARKY